VIDDSQLQGPLIDELDDLYSRRTETTHRAFQAINPEALQK
jgi:hypothetical protein